MYVCCRYGTDSEDINLGRWVKHAEDKHPFSPSVEALTQVSSDVNEEEMTPGMQEAQQVRGWRGIVRRDLVRRGLVRRGLVRSSL